MKHIKNVNLPFIEIESYIINIDDISYVKTVPSLKYYYGITFKNGNHLEDISENALDELKTILFSDKDNRYEKKKEDNFAVAMYVADKFEEGYQAGAYDTERKQCKDLNFLKNAIDRKQCYNCALRKECEAKNPRWEPIGTCDKWTNEGQK